MDIFIRKFSNTDIAEMTRLIQQQYMDELSEKTREWIDAEISNLAPMFDEYTRSTLRGCLMRSCFIATVFRGWGGKSEYNQTIHLKDKK